MRVCIGGTGKPTVKLFKGVNEMEPTITLYLSDVRSRAWHAELAIHCSTPAAVETKQNS